MLQNLSLKCKQGETYKNDTYAVKEKSYAHRLILYIGDRSWNSLVSIEDISRHEWLSDIANAKPELSLC